MEDSRIPEHERKQEFLDALASGQKIQAIKIYREMTGCDLRDAKDATEQIAADLAEKYPEQFARATGSGCGTAAAMLAFLGGLAALVVIAVT